MTDFGTRLRRLPADTLARSPSSRACRSSRRPARSTSAGAPPPGRSPGCCWRSLPQPLFWLLRAVEFPATVAALFALGAARLADRRACTRTGSPTRLTASAAAARATTSSPSCATAASARSARWRSSSPCSSRRARSPRWGSIAAAARRSRCSARQSSRDAWRSGTGTPRCRRGATAWPGRPGGRTGWRCARGSPSARSRR